jgi:hypothetical protein
VTDTVCLHIEDSNTPTPEYRGRHDLYMLGYSRFVEHLGPYKAWYMRPAHSVRFKIAMGLSAPSTLACTGFSAQGDMRQVAVRWS